MAGSLNCNGTVYTVISINGPIILNQTISLTMAAMPLSGWPMGVGYTLFSGLHNTNQCTLSCIGTVGPRIPKFKVTAIIHGSDAVALGTEGASGAQANQVPADDLTTLGTGIDFVTGSQLESPFNPIAAGDVNTVNDAKSLVKKVVVADSYSCQNAYNLAASFSGSGLFDSVSASFDIQKQCAFSATSFSMVAGAQVTTQSQTTALSNYTLTDEAASVLKNNGVAAFIARYGTHFVSALTSGGYGFANLTLTTSTSTDQQSLSANFSASANFFAASESASASYQQESQSCSVSFSASSLVQFNGKIPGVVKSDPDSISDAMDNFVANLEGDPSQAVVLWADITPYDYIPAIQSILNDIGQPNGLTFNIAPLVAQTLNGAYGKLRYQGGSCDQMLQGNTYAVGAQQGVLTQQIARIGNAMEAIASLDVVDLQTMTIEHAQDLDKSELIGDIVTPTLAGGVVIYCDMMFDDAHIPGGEVKRYYTLYSQVSSTEAILTRQHQTNGIIDGFMTVGVSYQLGGASPSFLAYLIWNQPLVTTSGNAIDLSGNGSGTSTVTCVPWPVNNWANMTLAVGGEPID